VLDTDGTKLGIMSGRDAYYLAQKKNLDLVKISPNSKPPVCKILDYGKFKYETAKKEKEAKRNQQVSELKEILLSMTIDTHDLNTKAKHARKFLTGGDKVKVTIRMRGRQQAHSNLGIKVMEDFYAIVEDVAQIDRRASTEGRAIIMILTPKKLGAEKSSGAASSKPQERVYERPQGQAPKPFRPNPNNANNNQSQVAKPPFKPNGQSGVGVNKPHFASKPQAGTASAKPAIVNAAQRPTGSKPSAATPAQKPTKPTTSGHSNKPTTNK